MRYIILGIILGLIFVLSMFELDFVAKKKPKMKIDIPLMGIKNSTVIINGTHIHHWLIFTIILLMSLINMGINRIVLNVLRGFSVIMILHGLMYPDRFDFEVR